MSVDSFYSGRLIPSDWLGKTLWPFTPIWVFPYMEVPLNHLFYSDCPYKPSILGYPHLWKPPLISGEPQATYSPVMKWDDSLSCDPVGVSMASITPVIIIYTLPSRALIWRSQQITMGGGFRRNPCPPTKRYLMSSSDSIIRHARLCIVRNEAPPPYKIQSGYHNIDDIPQIV